jgi:Type IV secretion system pilin
MIKKIVLFSAVLFIVSWIFTFQHVSAQSVKDNTNFYTALEDSVTTDYSIRWPKWWWIKDFLQEIVTGKGLWAQNISDFIVKLITKIIIPILVLVWIVYAIIWFYKLMTSDDSEELAKWRNYILWWLIGALIMVTAAWIVIQLVWENGAWWIVWDIIWTGDKPSWAQIVSDVYSKIFYPLIRVILNIIIWVMFLYAVGQWFKYLFSGDDEAQQKALSILVYTVVGILVIILAKTLVEITYGKYENVVSGDALLVRPWSDVDVWKIGDGVFDKPEASMLYTVLNRVLALGTFFITIIIIYIGYLMLIKPTDDETTTKLKNAITRWLAGVLVIGLAYVLANFVIIN